MTETGLRLSPATGVRKDRSAHPKPASGPGSGDPGPKTGHPLLPWPTPVRMRDGADCRAPGTPSHEQGGTLP